MYFFFLWIKSKALYTVQYTVVYSRLYCRWLHNTYIHTYIHTYFAATLLHCIIGSVRLIFSLISPNKCIRHFSVVVSYRTSAYCIFLPSWRTRPPCRFSYILYYCIQVSYNNSYIFFIFFIHLLYSSSCLHASPPPSPSPPPPPSFINRGVRDVMCCVVLLILIQYLVVFHFHFCTKVSFQYEEWITPSSSSSSSLL
jgi:hypothetical protein